MKCVCGNEDLEIAGQLKDFRFGDHVIFKPVVGHKCGRCKAHWLEESRAVQVYLDVARHIVRCRIVEGIDFVRQVLGLQVIANYDLDELGRMIDERIGG
jgi:hypothetical protein